jgi:hypothetical protein
MWVSATPICHTIYTDTMAKGSNTIHHRIVSFLCLLAILLVAIPYATCAPIDSHSMANMPAGHCDPCCPTSVSATAACCLAHPEPAVPTAQPAASIPLTVSSDALALPERAWATPTILRTNNFRTPPPPLITNLRI